MRRTFSKFCSAMSGSAAAATMSTPSSVESAPHANATHIPISQAKREFIEKFRERLAADPEKANLDSYVEGTDVPVSLSSVGPLKRGHEPLPPWLKLKIPKGSTHRPRYNKIRASMREKKLSTVCEEAKCPNIGECWGGGDDGEHATATIMLMGSHCTRGCRFCSVLTSRTPPPLDPEEPIKTADAVKEMGVDYIVLTMVDRDDIADGGCSHIVNCVKTIKEKNPTLLLEALVGDFNGRTELISNVASSGLNVFAHNIECVERITPNVRDRRANYRQTLAVLEHASKVQLDAGANGGQSQLFTKSSIMLGLGEKEEEIRQCLRDLRTAGVSAVTLGQYLQPSRTRLKVSRYAHPLEFEMWEKEALAMGFLYCASGPMVRSSYRAGEYYIKNILQKQMAEAKKASSDAALEGTA